MPRDSLLQPVTDPGALGAAIRARRKRDGLTLVETAGLADVGVRFLSELENGKPTVRLDKVLTVLKGLGLVLHLAPADLEIHPGERLPPFRLEDVSPGGPKML